MYYKKHGKLRICAGCLCVLICCCLFQSCSATPQTLRILVDYQGGLRTGSPLVKLKEEFCLLYPDVTVTIEEFPPLDSGEAGDIAVHDAALEKLRVEIMSGGGADLFLMGFPSLEGPLFPRPLEASSNGVFADVRELMTQADQETIPPETWALLQQCNTNEGLTMVPLCAETEGFLVVPERMEQTTLATLQQPQSFEQFWTLISTILPDEASRNGIPDWNWYVVSKLLQFSLTQSGMTDLDENFLHTVAAQERIDLLQELILAMRAAPHRRSAGANGNWQRYRDRRWRM